MNLPNRVNIRALGPPLRSALLTLLSGTSTAKGVSAEADTAYRKAMEDAAFPQEEESTGNPIPISRDNPNLRWKAGKNEILVATWKAQRTYESPSSPTTRHWKIRNTQSG